MSENTMEKSRSKVVNMEGSFSPELEEQMNDIKNTNEFDKNSKNIDKKRISNNKLKSKEEDNMNNDYITQREFNQFEKNIDYKINRLEKEISDIPEKMEDKIKILLNEQLQEIQKEQREIQKEQKEDKKTIITLTISGTSAIVAILGLLGKAFGWF
ncbi:hypothetical protein QJ729_01910 [Staphylococcus hominis]|uniref:hypothetical protein n=1 Tax=Staphylococcus hominis TaxID=1290 RepID=UPI0034CEFE7C